MMSHQERTHVLAKEQEQEDKEREERLIRFASRPILQGPDSATTAFGDHNGTSAIA